MDTIQQNILKALAYFDIFHYPLTNNEVRLFLSIPVDQAAVDESLHLLAGEQIIFKLQEFYSLQNDQALSDRRRSGNRHASKQMLVAAKASRILSCFPYVRALAISGSLSKNFSDEKSDIDFFIITKANRLWVARTIMHLFKKLSYLAGRKNWFCMNYYIDEAMLEIPEKNIFTAMEIVTVIPMYGPEAFQSFLDNNNWVKNYFPAKSTEVNSVPEIKKSISKKIIEAIFNSAFGNMLDNRLMKITDKRWQRKAAMHKLNDHGICMGMKVDKHFSKPNPKNFQDKVVLQYEKKASEVLLIQPIIAEANFNPVVSFEMK